MENDIRNFLIVSLLLHVGVFAVFSLQLKRTTIIMLPVELMFSNPPGAAAPAAAAKETIAPSLAEKKDAEIALKKKDTKKQSVKPKNEAPPKAAEPKKPAAGSGDGAGTSANGLPGPSSAGTSSPVSFDAAKFPYTYYTNGIVKKIGRSWQWSQDYGNLKAIVYFRVLRSGVIAQVDVTTSSGDRYFDDQAVRAIKLANPLPPLPDGYAEDSLGVYFEFSYRP